MRGFSPKEATLPATSPPPYPSLRVGQDTYPTHSDKLLQCPL